MTSDELRKAIQSAYCCDLHTYLEIFGLPDNEYARSKWKKMQDNFGKWYCDLDTHNADLFVKEVLTRS